MFWKEKWWFDRIERPHQLHTFRWEQRQWRNFSWVYQGRISRIFQLHLRVKNQVIFLKKIFEKLGYFCSRLYSFKGKCDTWLERRCMNCYELKKILIILQDSKKPDIRRCFAVSVLTNNGKTKKDKFFCVFTTNNGSISLDETNSNFEAIEWVTKLNRRYKTTQVKAAQEALKSLTVLIEF